MIIKEAEYKTCECCEHIKQISAEEYGCDNCGTPISYELNEKRNTDYLSVTVFREEENQSMTFCSWACTFAKLHTLANDYRFISLPFLHSDNANPEQNAPAFFALLSSQEEGE